MLIQNGGHKLQNCSAKNAGNSNLNPNTCLQIQLGQYMAICDDTRIQIATLVCQKLPFGGDTNVTIIVYFWDFRKEYGKQVKMLNHRKC